MQPSARPKSPKAGQDKLALSIAVGACAGNAAALLATFRSHLWLLDAQGRPVAEDFVTFWAAGKLATSGNATAVYNAQLLHAGELAIVGHDFSGFFSWSYPPLFLFVAAALAALPYVPAFVSWIGATVAAYAAAISQIAHDGRGLIFACAAPWVLVAVTPGQNGFLTAALIGAALAALPSRPLVAGLFVGLLSYKPQFAFLIPIALASGKHWRTLVCCFLTALCANVLACKVFGGGTAIEFVRAVADTAGNHLVRAGVGWNKLQSVYGLFRSFGVGAAFAWAAQTAASTGLAGVVAIYWRTDAPYSLKAALLASAIPLATPYVFAYDLPILTVACAFLYRDRAFDRTEILLLAPTAVMIFGVFLAPFPTAFFASLTIAGLVARRMISRYRQFAETAPLSHAPFESRPGGAFVG